MRTTKPKPTTTKPQGIPPLLVLILVLMAGAIGYAVEISQQKNSWERLEDDIEAMTEHRR